MIYYKPILIAIFSVFFILGLLAEYPNVNNANKRINVLAQGQGITKAEALEDALKDAIVKAVGAYIVARSTLENDDLIEEIYVNADAVISHYEERRLFEKDGVVTLEIVATVVGNELARYIKKGETSAFTQLDKINLFNHRDALVAAEKSLEYIFEDYGTQIFQFSKKNLSWAHDDQVDSVNARIELAYDITIDQQAYAKFENRLKNLLDKIAIEKQEGNISAQVNPWDSDNGKLYLLCRKGMSKGRWPTGTKIIILCNHYFRHRQKYLKYYMYAVPNQIRKKIDELDDSFYILVVRFEMKEAKNIVERRVEIPIEISRYDFGGEVRIIENMFDDPKYFKKGFKTIFDFQRDDVKKINSITGEVYSGIKARYLDALNRYTDMATLASHRQYVPAMLAMAEIFGEEYFYYRAALAGSRKAQQKLGWKSSGLGFEILIDNESNAVVSSARKGSPAQKGMVLKKINGKQLRRVDADELSSIVGELLPGASVTIEFTNGETHTFNVLPK